MSATSLRVRGDYRRPDAMSDYHLHLHPHNPRPGAPPMGEYPPGYIDRYVEVALSRGVTEIGFTEHLYRCVEAADALGRWWTRESSPLLRAQMEEMLASERHLSLEKYVAVVLDAKARGLPVRLGLEVDFEPGRERHVLDLIAPYPWDYLVGSVHWIGGWHFVGDDAVDEFRRRGVEVAWRQYFELETALAASGMVDVLAHVDVVKKMGLRPSVEVMQELWRPLVTAAVEAGVAVEVSSAGLRRSSKEIFPAPALLAQFGAAGVPIMLASDAHIAEDAAWGHDLVVAAARAAGYEAYLRFDARRSQAVPLPMLGAVTAGRSTSAG
jgi:histidinol-phosphatase (PHP family)